MFRSVSKSLLHGVVVRRIEVADGARATSFNLFQFHEWAGCAVSCSG